MNKPGSIILPLVLALLLICLPPTARADSQQLNESRIKAAFVFNVARYVSWPAASNEPFVIGVLGRGTVDSAWQELRGKTVHGRTLDVRKSDDLDDLLNCQIVFITASKRKNLSQILLLLQDYPILSISDTEGFAQAGGMVHLIKEDDRIRFRINLAAAHRSGLKISSQLLKLAKGVIE